MINREDLTYSYNHRGYTILYKGKSIGGSGVLPTAKVTSTQANSEFFKQRAEIAISGVLKGRRPDLVQKIRLIDSEEPSMLTQVDAVKTYAREVIDKFPIREHYVLYVDSLDNGYFRVFAILKWREAEAGRWLLRAKIQEKIGAMGYKSLVYVFYEHEGLPYSDHDNRGEVND